LDVSVVRSEADLTKGKFSFSEVKAKGDGFDLALTTFRETRHRSSSPLEQLKFTIRTRGMGEE